MRPDRVTTTLWTSLTRTGTWLVISIPGTVPLLPAPCHATSHTTVAFTVNLSSGCPADERW